MAQQIVQVDAARRDRSLVPEAHGIEAKLKAEPVLLLWRRLIDLAVYEAKLTRFGEPTDGAILAHYWIETVDVPDAKRREFRATFERACTFLLVDPMQERARLLREIDSSLRRSAVSYARRRLELRRRAVLTTARASEEMTRSLALLLVSTVEYEETAGINRADPPQRKTQVHAAKT